jgi:methylmalonyl-CoA mutase C-terminal domain/subunit
MGSGLSQSPVEGRNDLVTERKIRILMAKPGLEGHWVGLLVVSRALRDAGYEVIYGGNMTPEGIAAAAVQEDVEVVGLSILSANYMQLVPRTIEELRKRGKGDVSVLLGGIIFQEDLDQLRQMGVAGVFPSGTPLEDILQFVRQKVGQPI